MTAVRKTSLSAEVGLQSGWEERACISLVCGIGLQSNITELDRVVKLEMLASIRKNQSMLLCLALKCCFAGWSLWRGFAWVGGGMVGCVAQ